MTEETCPTCHGTKEVQCSRWWDGVLGTHRDCRLCKNGRRPCPRCVLGLNKEDS